MNIIKASSTMKNEMFFLSIDKMFEYINDKYDKVVHLKRINQLIADGDVISYREVEVVE